MGAVTWWGAPIGGPTERPQPNTALEATGHSVRFVAGEGLYRVARASAWALGSSLPVQYNADVVAVAL